MNDDPRHYADNAPGFPVLLIAGQFSCRKNKYFFRDSRNTVTFEYKLETQFRRGNHETHCSKRLIVHGWKDLASQVGYPQDIINNQIINKVDFVIAIFRHKLGMPTIDTDTGKNRAESGTVEELLTALDNTKREKPLGMAYFYSKAPILSLDSNDFDTTKQEWDKLSAFKKDISKKMIYKPDTELDDLLQTIIIDLENNIKNYFE